MLTPPNTMQYLVKHHSQDLLREAEAERLKNEARRGSAHPSTGLVAPLRAALVAIARIGQQGVPEQVRPAEKAQSGIALPVAKS
jgi:hypothetical protein